MTPSTRPGGCTTRRSSPLLLAALLLAAAPASAQRGTSQPESRHYHVSSVNGDAQPPLVSLGAARTPPDTTAPWRYYPLAVGNAWEYWTGGTTVVRREVTHTAEINGRLYASVEEGVSRDGDPPDPSDPNGTAAYSLRYDTLSARVVEPNGAGGERPFIFTPCPFDAAFGSVIECLPDRHYSVSGGEGLVVFGAPPGVEPDSARTTLKVFEFDAFVDVFAAGFGSAYSQSEVGGVLSLAYARIDGVEYGVSRFPTAAGDAPARPPTPALRLWPNPSRGRLTVSFVAVRVEAARLVVRDVLGREVAQSDLGVMGLGLHEVPADLSGLAPGTYAVQVWGQALLGAAVVTRVR